MEQAGGVPNRRLRPNCPRLRPATTDRSDS